MTATLAGQIVMEGFLRLRIPHWARRLITRATGRLLVTSPSFPSLLSPGFMAARAYARAQVSRNGEPALGRRPAGASVFLPLQ